MIYNSETSGKDGKETELLAGLLRYFVTPSYLRKTVFTDLAQFEAAAKKLPKLPRVPFLSHSSSGNSSGSGKYLQGLSVSRKVEKKKGKNKKKRQALRAEEELTPYINIGESKFLELSNGVKVPINSRVLVDLEKKAVVGVAEVYGKPDKEDPIWMPESFGYSVREVSSFGQVFTECPYPDGYKYTAWVPCAAEELSNDSATKQALTTISLVEDESFLKQGVPQSDPTQKNEDIPVLLVFGGWPELSAAILADQATFAGMTEAEPLFDGRVRVSRATRVEDAALAVLGKIDGL